MGKVCELFITHIAINWFGCGYQRLSESEHRMSRKGWGVIWIQNTKKREPKLPFLSFLLAFKQRYPFEGKEALLPIAPAQNRQR